MCMRVCVCICVCVWVCGCIWTCYTKPRKLFLWPLRGSLYTLLPRITNLSSLSQVLTNFLSSVGTHRYRRILELKTDLWIVGKNSPFAEVTGFVDEGDRVVT